MNGLPTIEEIKKAKDLVEPITNEIMEDHLMKSSEIEPVADKASLPYEFYEDYIKRREIVINGVLLGLIDNPIDIDLYHKLYQDLQAEKDNSEFKPNKSTAQRFINLLKEYEIEIQVGVNTKLPKQWQLPMWRVLKDNQVIAEFGHAEIR